MVRRPQLALLLGLALIVSACAGAATPGAATPGAAQTAAPPATAAPAATAPAAPAGDTAVKIAGFAFDPASVTVGVGSTVTWTNEDTASHTVKWDDGSAGSGSLSAGGPTYSRTFDTPGTFAYACGIHPAMKGVVVVEP